LERWQVTASDLVWHPPTQSGRGYRIVDLDSKVVVPLDHPGILKVGVSSARVIYVPGDVTNPLTVLVPGRTAITNGGFANGPWGQVGDCYTVNPRQANLGARVIANGAPGGLAALQLSADFDSACESQLISWRGEPLVLSLMIHPVEGVAPRICMWEFGPNRCSPLPAIPEQRGWSTYRVSVRPDAGTTAIGLFLYADAGSPGTRTVNEYANVRVLEVAALPSFVLLSDPEPLSLRSMQLVVVHSSFSTEWQGPIGGYHVLVDGMLNGWLMPIGSREFSAYYGPAIVFLTAQWLSLAIWLSTLLLPICFWVGRLFDRLRNRDGG
jgi:hypothetical protein